MTNDKSLDCIFCGIAEKKIKANIALETERLVAFHDIHKVADVHLLIIPKIHLENINDINSENAAIMADIAMAAKLLATKFGVDQSGYRLVMNTGSDGGQTVFHLHMHFLAGRSFSWPPG